MRYFVARGEHRRLDPTRGELRVSFVQCSDGVTHYELTGPDSGEVVVLVGGLTIPLFYWYQLADELHRRGFRTLAYSGYGRGYSDRPPAVYDEALFVRQLSELTEQLGLTGPWHVVGTSMGALLAMAFAAQHVEQAATLTLVGPGGLEAKPPAGAGLLRHDRLGTSRHDLYERAGRSPVPSMLLWGAEDQATPITRLDEVRGLLNPLECHVFQQCGHMASYERPAEVAAKFGSFADRAGHRSQR